MLPEPSLVGRFFLALAIVFVHFYVARSIRREIDDCKRTTAYVSASPRLGLMYLAVSGLVYLVAFVTAFWIKWR